MINIPRGAVEMRDDRMEKSWTADIEAFQLSKFLVTQDLYKSVTSKNPATFRGMRLPVESVSWFEAVIFCNKLSECVDKIPCYTMDPGTHEVILNPDVVPGLLRHMLCIFPVIDRIFSPGP